MQKIWIEPWWFWDGENGIRPIRGSRRTKRSDRDSWDHKDTSEQEQDPVQPRGLTINTQINSSLYGRIEGASPLVQLHLDQAALYDQDRLLHTQNCQNSNLINAQWWKTYYFNFLTLYLKWKIVIFLSDSLYELIIIYHDCMSPATTSLCVIMFYTNQSLQAGSIKSSWSLMDDNSMQCHKR